MVPSFRATAGEVCRWLVRTARVTWPAHVWWVVNYHDVSDQCDTPRPTVRVAQFREQLDALRSTFEFIGLEEGFRRRQAGAIDGRFISVTFDDGYAGVVKNAYPVLERLKIPATVFVCGATLYEGRELWDIALHRLVQAGRIGDVTRITGLPPQPNGPAAVRALRPRWTADLAEQLVHQAREVRDPPPAPGFDLDAAARLNPAFLSVGNHTWNHAVVSSLSRTEATVEIGRTDQAIRRLPAFVPIFAYPFGEAGDMSAEATRLAQDCFGLHVVSAYGGCNRSNVGMAEDARRVGLPSEVRLPWDLSVVAALSTLRDLTTRTSFAPRPHAVAPGVRAAVRERGRFTRDPEISRHDERAHDAAHDTSHAVQHMPPVQ